jgi:hypothetical protein
VVTIAPAAVRACGPAQVIGLVPYLLGFRPAAGDLVIMGAVPPGYRVQVTLRLEMPARPALVMQVVQARSAVAVLATAGCTVAVMVGYGPDQAVAGYATAIRQAAAGAGITMTELLRVHDQRWWSYGCLAPSCCPADGTPLSPSPDPAIAGPLEAAGCRVLPSRDAVAAAITPVTGADALAARLAARRAEERAGRLARLPGRPGRVATRRPIDISGIRAVLAAIRIYRGGGGIASADEVAWLARVLCEPDVRDAAWLAMDPGQRDAHQRLWACVTRLAQPGCVAAPACLLALAAWQSGNGPLARLALDRAEADQPSYDLARVLRPPIESGAPPPLGDPAVIWSRLRLGPSGPGRSRSSHDLGSG